MLRRSKVIRQAPPPKISSDFAILDVKKGRAALAKRIAMGERFRAVIYVTLDDIHSRDDGTSIEFSGVVTACDLYSESGKRNDN